MTPKERVRAAIRGEIPDRVPVALWRHFPHDDASAQGLARRVIAFQERFDFDLVKVTPASGYMAEAWGAKLTYKENDEGTRAYVSRPVNSPQDWEALEPADVRRGVLGRELEALRLIREGVGPDVPVLQTVFSPLTTAKNLAGGRWLEDLRRHPDALKVGLEVIARTTGEFARAALESGADAIFFATQLASADLLTTADYEAFGVPYDLHVLEAVRQRADFILLHLHGMNVMFDLLRDYPVQIVNWHDRRTPPSLAEGLKAFKGAVLGGLNGEVLLRGTPEDVERQARQALEQTGGRRFLLGAGCVTPIHAPEENLRAARAAGRDTRFT